MKEAIHLTGRLLKKPVTRRELWLAIPVSIISLVGVLTVATVYRAYLVPMLVTMVVVLPVAWLVCLQLRINRALRNTRVMQFDFRNKTP